MYDIHCHILPGLDDGAKDLQESIALLHLAINDGITHIVTTPHIHLGRYDNSISSISAKFKQLQSYISAHNLAVKLAMAAEVRLDIGVLALIENKHLPFLGQIENNDCMLLEFPHSHMPIGYEKFIAWLAERNITVIVAHPERNRDIQQNSRHLDILKKHHCLFQLTASSIVGDFGERAAALSRIVLQQNMADFVASDAHSVKRRPPILSSAYNHICEQYSQGYAQRLFFTNPRRLTDALFQHYN